MSRLVKTWWWRTEKNWGDELAPLLLAQFANIREIQLVPPVEAELLTLGSIIDMVPKGWGGIIAGSGMLVPKINSNLESATVFGVRGPLTHSNLRYHRGFQTTYGDPGLLADELPDVVPNTRDVDLAVLPHWSDKELVKRKEWYGHWKTIQINPRDDPRDVIRQIGRAKKLVTSSLHGCIVADAFGIPRRLEMSEFVMTRPKEGGTFKFEDYHASVKMPFVIGETQRSVRNVINERKDVVYDMYRELQSVFN